MDRIKTALERLDEALDRLEAALDSREARWKRERVELVRASEAARAEEAQVRATAEAVSARLDDAIGRLETVLED